MPVAAAVAVPDPRPHIRPEDPGEAADDRGDDLGGVLPEGLDGLPVVDDGDDDGGHEEGDGEDKGGGEDDGYRVHGRPGPAVHDLLSRLPEGNTGDRGTVLRR